MEYQEGLSDQSGVEFGISIRVLLNVEFEVDFTQNIKMYLNDNTITIVNNESIIQT